MISQFIAIDLKSFYASVECVKRNLNPLKTNLVVADKTRTEKTICLAVTPSLKAYGIAGRARLFEVVQKVREVNQKRRAMINGRPFRGKSCNADELELDPYLELDFIVAPPCMADYVNVSSKIYGIYLKYISSEDISVYSIDEVFIDATHYLRSYAKTAEELARTMISDVLSQTGITATAGIGTNLYLCKIAMDIIAKKIKADKYGVRIASLDEMSYRQLLWDYRPITDFWRIGHGTAKRLESHGMFTMGDIAFKSIHNEKSLYSLFGVNAELIIDHAWGYENVDIADIKAYCPENSSLSSGQVLQTPYTFEKARICIVEMADSIAMKLVENGLVTNQISIAVVYDPCNLNDYETAGRYTGRYVKNHYGKIMPEPSKKTVNLDCFTSSGILIMQKVSAMFREIAYENLLVRRLFVFANNVVSKDRAAELSGQLLLFGENQINSDRENKVQTAVLKIKRKYGKNAVLRAVDLEEGATAVLRNGQIGGHKS